jgi:hypothetical protein
MTRSFDLLEINRGLFVKMEELALKQEKLIVADQIKGFLNLQSQRERLRNDIDRNTVKFRAMTKNDSSNLKDKKVDILSQEIAGVIQSIQEIDGKIEGYISEKQDSLFSEIKGYRQGQKALKGYGGHSSKKAKYISRTE